MSAKYIVADVFDGLATLEDGSVDLVVTSPPFLALRSYLPADHPDKAKEIGSEATPAEFLDVMLKVTAELRRVLAPHGSIAIELGDTYAGTGGAGGDWSDSELTTKARVNGGSDGGPTRRLTLEGWPLAKSKTLIPELYRIALAYGFNPLTGEPSPAGRWRVRNVVTWARPNPPVGLLGDKWRPATSDVVVACLSGKRYWDDLATRKDHQRWPREPEAGMYREGGPPGGDNKLNRGDLMNSGGNPSGAPLLDYWEIPPGGYQGSHYAVFPPELVVPLVKAMCPSKVCRTCGEPSRRIVENGAEYERDSEWRRQLQRTPIEAGRLTGTGAKFAGAELSTTGWTDCGHDDWRPGLVLDPFAGSGTTLMVAQGHGHDAIGIDLDPRNAELALERVGPFFLEVVT